MCERGLVNMIQLDLLEKKNVKKINLKKKISVVFVIVNNTKKLTNFMYFFYKINKVRRESYSFIIKSKGENL